MVLGLLLRRPKVVAVIRISRSVRQPYLLTYYIYLYSEGDEILNFSLGIMFLKFESWNLIICEYILVNSVKFSRFSVIDMHKYPELCALF